MEPYYSKSPFASFGFNFLMNCSVAGRYILLLKQFSLSASISLLKNLDSRALTF